MQPHPWNLWQIVEKYCKCEVALRQSNPRFQEGWLQRIHDGEEQGQHRRSACEVSHHRHLEGTGIHPRQRLSLPKHLALALHAQWERTASDNRLQKDKAIHWYQRPSTRGCGFFQRQPLLQQQSNQRTALKPQRWSRIAGIFRTTADGDGDSLAAAPSRWP